MVHYFLVLSVAFSGLCFSDPIEKYSFTQTRMGMAVWIHLYCESETKALAASDKAFEKMSELEMVFSDYESESELRKLQPYQVGQPLKISHPLLEVLLLSRQLHQKSLGAFDPTLRPLSMLWRQARHSGQMPSPDLLKKALARVGFQHLTIDSDQSTVTFNKENITLDCGAIAKGAIVDAALKVLCNEGIKAALIDAGGDMAMSSPPPGTKGWEIKIEGVSGKTLLLSHAAVATSGDHYQSVTINGTRYSHLIDPRTGMALSNSCQVTAIAPNAALADGLASSLSLIDLNDCLTFLSNFSSCEALIQSSNDTKSPWMSPGFREALN